MPNPIKYSVSAQTLALKKGNFWIGTGDVGKGPTSTTSYYNGITPPSGGYTIYLNKASGGPSIYTAANDSQLISLTNTIAGQTFATASAALDWYNSQSDKMVFNIDYPAIMTNGLIFNADAGFTPSYPTSGTTWYDLSGNSINGTLTNGPTYSSSGGGSISFDGTDDRSVADTSLIDRTDGQEITVSCWIRPSRLGGQYQVFCTNRSNDTSRYNWIFYQHTNNGAVSFHGGNNQFISTYIPTVNTWVNVTNTVTSAGLSTLYANGVSVYAVSGYSYGLTASRLGIGADPGGQEAFQGNVASTQIYTRALTAAEVLQNFNATKTRFGL
jgi:hypothetical protein